MVHLEWQRLSIVDWEVRAVIAALFVTTVASSWQLFRRRLIRWSVRAASLPLVALFAAAAINAHYDYFPTAGALFGRNAADQISSSTFAHLKHVYGNPLGHARGRSRVVPTRELPDRGVVLAFSMPGTASGFPAHTGQVYLPPAWFAHPRPRLPVIELLHGSPGSPADWTRAGGADVTADAYAAAHDGFAPILVMPDINAGWRRDTECVNGPQGNAETYLTTDVRNAVVRAFGPPSSGAYWGIAGLSEGGSCALQIGLRHPSLFSAVGDFSGDDHPWINSGPRYLFWGATDAQRLAEESAYDPRVLLEAWHARSGPRIVFVSGRHDPVLPKMERLLMRANRDGLRSELVVLHGGHTFWLWRRSFSVSLPILMHNLGTRSLVGLITQPSR